jgi:hypothetical protein
VSGYGLYGRGSIPINGTDLLLVNRLERKADHSFPYSVEGYFCVPHTLSWSDA